MRLVDIVSDGTVVPQRIGEHRPDVIVIDALLQGRLRGMPLVKQLHDAKTGIPIIVLTVPQNPITVDPDKGIDEVLSMPFNGYDLITRIANVHKAASAATEKGPSRLVVVFAPKGGVGKSTIAFNLGVAASGLGLRTALVDGSIQFGDLRGLLKRPATPGRCSTSRRTGSPNRIWPTSFGPGRAMSTSCSPRPGSRWPRWS